VCFAEAIVDAVGVDKIKEQVTPAEVREAGDALPSDLGVEVTKDDGEKFYSAVDDCLDIGKYFGDQIDSDDTLTDEAKSCLKKELDAEFLHTFYVTLYAEGSQGFSADTDLMNEINAAYETCGVSAQ
jgi:hypothetical protein